MDEIADPREAAIKRLKAKQGFKAHLAAYVIVNTFLVLLWAVTSGGAFWPFWTIVGWGIGLAFHAWAVYFQRQMTEDDIAREMRRSH